MRILIVFGTRPEAIKMAPLVHALKSEPMFCVKVCVTSQHREMLDEVLNVFGIKPDYDLDVMKPEQVLYEVTTSILQGMKPVLEDFRPEMVFVHGDTTTTLAATIAAFYCKVKVAHVEAGLRTHNLYSPWPEEANRKITSVIADINFSPTKKSADNLINESVCDSKVFIVGNTVIDALYYIKNKIQSDEKFYMKLRGNLTIKHKIDFDKKIILLTAHRRENFGNGFSNICTAVKHLSLKFPNLDFIFPVHLNPNIQKPAKDILSNLRNVKLINPLSYEEFVFLLMKCNFVLTDSGGLQEEAPSFGKPVLVLRDTTERPEAVEAGTVRLVGTDVDAIVANAEQLIIDEQLYKKMSCAHNPYGDGSSCERILNILKSNFVV